MARALIDSNVIIDALTNRPGSVEYERQILRFCVSRKLDLAISSKQITDIHYVLRKYFPEEVQRRAFIGILLRSFEVLPLNSNLIELAISSENSDYEDAVLSETALHNGIDVIITNDPKGYKKTNIKTISPSDFLKKEGLI